MESMPVKTQKLISREYITIILIITAGTVFSEVMVLNPYAGLLKDYFDSMSIKL